MDDVISKREVGDVLENNIENIFKAAGFRTERNKRIATYEIDVVSYFGDRKVVIECKNYQKSHLVIRNLIHQWNSKNDVIKADKIILVIYGVQIKDSDKKLASKYSIELWGQNDIDLLFPMLMKPQELRNLLLKEIDFKPVSVSDFYETQIERLILYPILMNAEEDENETYESLLHYLKAFIRTELNLKGTSKEERSNHIETFEDIKKRGMFLRSEPVDSSSEYWSELKKRLIADSSLPKNLMKKYSGYMDELDDEIEATREWFEGNDKEVMNRLIRSRLYDAMLTKGDVCKFGLLESHDIVEVKPLSEEDFEIVMRNLNKKQEEIINWILTSENEKRRFSSSTGDIFEEVTTWTFTSLEDAVESVYRLFDEYYEYDENSKLVDYSLQVQKKSGCFIATAAYGTPFAYEINVLRNWRDTKLVKSLFGRTFIRTYYLVSPPIAEIVSKSDILRKFVRFSLKQVIKLLHK